LENQRKINENKFLRGKRKLSCELESIRYDAMERDWEVELAEKHSEDMIS